MAAMGQPRVVVAFAQALTELTTVEKKNIVVLTEIARDALRTEPGAAPALATLITTRIVQAPPPQKLPALYLLDSISKLVGEPYKTLFAPALPEAFMCTWFAGAPGLHRPLDKLLGTWAGVFPQALLADIQARVAAARAAAAPPPALQPTLQPPGYGAGGGYGQAAPPPMAADPRLAQQQQQQQPVPMQPMQAALYPQPQVAPPAYGGYAQPPMQAPLNYPQQYAATAADPLALPPQQAAAPAAAQQASVPDLLASLMSAGLLAAPGAAPAAAAPGPELTGNAVPAAAAARATPEREQPATTTFTPERLKEHSASALARLLRTTEATKSRFLDAKFLRRQQRAAGVTLARGSRHWYLDLDTWQASTTGAAGAAGGGAAGAGGGAAGAAATAAALEPQDWSVPVDDSQTACALSGEPFEQFWDEGHQEWRYRGAKALDAEEAASYGLQEGAIALVSALGRPAEGVLAAAAAGDSGGGGGGGVLAELAARQEIAADLAAATAAEAGAAAGGEAAAGEDVKDIKPDVKPDVKVLEEAEAAAAAGAAAERGEPQEKRQRVA